VAALAQLAERRPELDPHLMLVGDGPQRAALTAQAERLGVRDRCQFAGARSEREVAEAMAAHEMLLVPSHTTADGWVEAFGKVALEGVATGMAVVASRSGGLPEAVGRAGTLVPPDDPTAMAEAVEHLVDTSSPAQEAARGHGSHRAAGEAWDSYDRLSRELAGLPPRG
jgi:glycosyltransferase involved in cell wall biosynthesis